ncbi:MAG: carboxymuconolactone decarboxylase family protein [Acidobacteria bacterium]|nr:carboxymuconolactone decarboxylase family protein [Acidobacteriota bacterium]
MPHIPLPENLPGISSGFAFRPETAAPMRELAHVLLYTSGRNTDLSSRDRELIAAFVSSRNDCTFCKMSHGAAATHLNGGDRSLLEDVWTDFQAADISQKVKTLLAIASAVQIDGKKVTPDMVKTARDAGASDLEIHDTVLIAAAFCMYNRYVDGLATLQPLEEGAYYQMGARLAEQGYIPPK